MPGSGSRLNPWGNAGGNARQITAAIKHFEDKEKEYECAVTLAGAAEGHLSTEDGSQHLFEKLKIKVPPEFKDKKDWTNWLNAT